MLFSTSLYNKPLFGRLIGQSNAQGSATVSLIPPGFDIPSSVSNAFIFNSYSSNFEIIKLGVNSDNIPPTYTPPSDTTLFYGCEMNLMNDLQKYFQSPMYLEKYGWGGSSLQTGAGSRVWNKTANDIFKLSSDNFNLAKIKLPLIDKTPDFIIWIQGEGDSSGSYLTNYPIALTQFITDLRDFHSSPNLMFIIVSLSTQQTAMSAGNIITMKNNQKSLAQYVRNIDSSTTIQTGGSVIQNVHYLDQNEPCENQSGVFIHYNYTGYRNIGKNLAKILIDYLK